MLAGEHKGELFVYLLILSVIMILHQGKPYLQGGSGFILSANIKHNNRDLETWLGTWACQVNSDFLVFLRANSPCFCGLSFSPLFICSILCFVFVLSGDGGSKGFIHPQIEIKKAEKGKGLVRDSETGDLSV